jgi:hypothetical protein
MTHSICIFFEDSTGLEAIEAGLLIAKYTGARGKNIENM